MPAMTTKWGRPEKACPVSQMNGRSQWTAEASWSPSAGLFVQVWRWALSTLTTRSTTVRTPRAAVMTRAGRVVIIAAMTTVDRFVSDTISDKAHRVVDDMEAGGIAG